MDCGFGFIRNISFDTSIWCKTRRNGTRARKKEQELASAEAQILVAENVELARTSLKQAQSDLFGAFEAIGRDYSNYSTYSYSFFDDIEANANLIDSKLISACSALETAEEYLRTANSISESSFYFSISKLNTIKSDLEKARNSFSYDVISTYGYVGQKALLKDFDPAFRAYYSELGDLRDLLWQATR